MLACSVACSEPGVLYSPEGTEPLRTAAYRVGLRGGEPELVVLLSNGEFTCGWPAFTDTNDQAEAIEGLLAAACREGAQHVSIRAYDRTARWSGSFPGRSGGSFGDLTEDQPRLSSGSFYAVEEAFLVQVDGLDRGYAASEELYFPEMGDGGTVELEPLGPGPGKGGTGPDRLRGWFDFPVQGISGEFLAEQCTGDTSLIDVVTAQTDHYCQ